MSDFIFKTLFPKKYKRLKELEKKEVKNIAIIEYEGEVKKIEMPNIPKGTAGDMTADDWAEFREKVFEVMTKSRNPNTQLMAALAAFGSLMVQTHFENKKALSIKKIHETVSEN